MGPRAPGAGGGGPSLRNLGMYVIGSGDDGDGAASGCAASGGAALCTPESLSAQTLPQTLFDTKDQSLPLRLCDTGLSGAAVAATAAAIALAAYRNGGRNGLLAVVTPSVDTSTQLSDDASAARCCHLGYAGQQRDEAAAGPCGSAGGHVARTKSYVLRAARGGSELRQRPRRSGSRSLSVATYSRGVGMVGMFLRSTGVGMAAGGGGGGGGGAAAGAFLSRFGPGAAYDSSAPPSMFLESRLSLGFSGLPSPAAAAAVDGGGGGASASGMAGWRSPGAAWNGNMDVTFHHMPFIAMGGVMTATASERSTARTRAGDEAVAREAVQGDPRVTSDGGMGS
ncbi:hypothetical protein GPECTOR_3g166 [Gonium pectorale]|uniref:Uncharacterized protein n=1 Tax=Gonium pectorale TaxID=33097 RepID=A0A150GZ69_GONPE|nr:hypothetical protein GPECTOR_3g166 [Gonium pectorale]|eukprot:KXZ55002.1 hypothetical protein GPECTOR_3g166 [Gonium pectorale]